MGVPHACSVIAALNLRFPRFAYSAFLGASLTLCFATVSCKKSSEAASAPAAPATPVLTSNVYDFDALEQTPTAVGFRKAVLDGPTATVDRTHVHITTLNPGQISGAPRRHVQEEVIIVKEGTIEANWDGQSKTAEAGSVIFFASGAVTFLRNVGTEPATYYVIYYYTPLTPKE
jgi:XRE family transcriptional regulator, regulator of sulfur utilization